MKKIFYSLVTLLILASCKTSKETKSDELNNKKIINVIINPITDSAFSHLTENRSVGNTNKKFQQYLSNELTAAFSSQHPLRFYTPKEAQKGNIRPDWIVDLKLVDFDISLDSLDFVSQNISALVTMSKDPLREPKRINTIYGGAVEVQTAAIDYTSRSYLAFAKLEVKITDIHTGKNVYTNTYTNKYHWDQKSAFISGDYLALPSNNGVVKYPDNPTIPRNADILNNLYMRLYTQIKSSINDLVSL
jgi:hypothetical protein